MSILLVGLDDAVAEVLVRRLVLQGDEVRILLGDPGGQERWKTAGAYVAIGAMDDDDFVERAAQHARTCVVGPHWSPATAETIVALVAGTSKAGVDRFVLVGPKVDAMFKEEVQLSGMSYVFLRVGRWGFLRKSNTVSPSAIAEAIDAADDLAGEVTLDLDLTMPEDWKQLRLEPRLS
ncbi:MAG TPA: hypothetical protein VFS18_01110 [Actinomycetota bacterium]|nr:hypothetical protein [Actinomycetota bacterium]